MRDTLGVLHVVAAGADSEISSDLLVSCDDLHDNSEDVFLSRRQKKKKKKSNFINSLNRFVKLLLFVIFIT